MTEFADHFGGHAADYVKFRPGYPEELLTFLADQAPHSRLAWDAGTGSGQVARVLAARFERVQATDASQKQLTEALSHPRVNYRCAEAQDSGLEAGSVGLITAAAAVHWFNIELFYREASRVLSPGGVIAVWTYAPDLLAPPGPAEVVRELAEELLGPDWPAGMDWVRARYKDLPFPFREIEVPRFDFSLRWSLDQLMGWISTWSAVRRYRERTGLEPLEGLRHRLLSAWPVTDGGPTEVQLPLYRRVGRYD